MHTQRLVQHLAHDARFVGGVHDLRDHRNAGELPDHVGAGEQPVAHLDLAVLKPHRLGPQHQVREIYFPWMRRDIGTFGHVTHITEITVIHDQSVDILADAVGLQCFGGVNRVEQGREGVTQIKAATATVADVEDALDLTHERIFVIEPRLLPFQRFPLRRLQAALGQNLICRDSHAWAVQALLAE